VKPPAVRRPDRDAVMGELREHRRNIDCTWPRHHESRPRCGKCFACGMATDVAMIAAGARHRH
jgi:hypothetical protein